MMSHTDSSHTVYTHKGQQVPLWNLVLGKEQWNWALKNEQDSTLSQNWAGEGHRASRGLGNVYGWLSWER